MTSLRRPIDEDKSSTSCVVITVLRLIQIGLVMIFSSVMRTRFQNGTLNGRRI